MCDKAKKARGKFGDRKGQYQIPGLPPYHRVVVDGYGGQKSFECKTFGGAVGGYIFCCDVTGAVDTKLYSSKDQFPRLLEKYLLEVIAKDYCVRVLVMDTDQVQISKSEVEPILAEYGCVLYLSSAGTPQENGLAENTVRRLKEGIRALVLGAPHVHKNRWGLAALYYCKIMFVLKIKSNGDKTPYYCVHKRSIQRNRS